MERKVEENAKDICNEINAQDKDHWEEKHSFSIKLKVAFI